MMATDISVETFTNICDDCPAANAILVAKKRLADKGLGPCELARFDIDLQLVNKRAGEIGCQLLEKALPNPETAIPDIGAEQDKYKEHCPAYAINTGGA